MSGLVNAIFGGGGSSAPAPDYTPMANASAEAARLGAELGREQLDENKRQYEKNLEVAAPLIAKQSAIMDQSLAQGADYFEYMKENQRPIEDALSKEAMAAGSESAQTEAARKAEAEVQSQIGMAQQQQTRSLNRMGVNPNSGKAVAAGTSASLAGAIGMAGASSQARTQEKNLGFAKKMDAAGLYRGLSGASSGAYQVASGAGSSAVGSQLGVSGQYMSGVSSGNGTIMGGQQMQIGGLGSILSSQTSGYTAGMSQQTAMRDQNLNLAGTAAGMFMSDSRLKRNIVKVADDLRGFGWYVYEYIWGGGPRMGVMAQELESVMPDAVVQVGDYKAVNYTMLKGAVL